MTEKSISTAAINQSINTAITSLSSDINKLENLTHQMNTLVNLMSMLVAKK